MTASAAVRPGRDLTGADGLADLRHPPGPGAAARATRGPHPAHADRPGDHRARGPRARAGDAGARVRRGDRAAVLGGCGALGAAGTVARIGSIVDYPNGSAHHGDAGGRGGGAGRGRGGRARRHRQRRVPAVGPACGSSLRTSLPWSRRPSPVGVKLMLELPLLDQQQAEHACAAAVDAGAAFVSIASSGSVGIADPAGIAVPAPLGSGSPSASRPPAGSGRSSRCAR